ncbi:MAG: hypothetical protein Q4C70_11655 [Planctomycetia bacterium]|nr:hypothetical protein [Planctomycetia bacterium]
MIRKIWFFFATLFLFIGIQLSITQSIVLTADATKYIASLNPKHSQTKKFYIAIFGNEPPYPEKEIPIKSGYGYIFFFFAGVGYLHCIAIPKK